MSSFSSKMSPARYTVAQARKDRSAAVSHPIFPLSLLYIKESITNSIRYGATTYDISFTWEPSSNAWKVESKDNGSGEADFDRMNGPAEENGETTSRYAYGLWALQVFGEKDNKLTSMRVAKKNDEDYARSVVTGPIPEVWDPRDLYHKDPKCPFKTRESHGFYNMHYISKDTIPDIGPNDILPNFREIVTVGFNQEILNKLNINVYINGNLVSNSHKPQWDSLYTAVKKKIGTSVNDDGKMELKAGHVNIKIHKLRHQKSDWIPNFLNYGRRSIESSIGFLFQDGILIEEQQIHQLVGHKLHPTSQTGCLAFVDFSLDNTELSTTNLPTPEY